jgi:hypothetical protein
MILMLIGTLIGLYVLTAAGFYAYMNVAAQPDPELEWASATSTPILQVVEGGLQEPEIRKAA